MSREPQSEALPAARKAELRTAGIKVVVAAVVAGALFGLYRRAVQVDGQVQDLLAGTRIAIGTRSGGARAELNRDTPRGWLAAEELLHKALELQSSNSYAIVALADVEMMLVEAGYTDRQERARAAVARAERKDVQLPERFEARALQMIAQGQSADAIPYLQGLLERYGAIPRLIDALGRAQRASGKLVEARQSFRRAQEADWRSPRAVADYAESLLEDGNALEAAQAFDRALQDNSDHSRAQIGKARALTALSLQGRGGADVKSARALCDAVLGKRATEVPASLKAEALAARAEVKLAEGNTTSAAQDASDAVQADPRSHLALRARAMTAAAAKSRDALAMFRSAADADPWDASTYFDGASALLDAADGDSAEKLLGAYAGKLPQSARFHLALARSMQRREAWKDAEGELLKAQQLEPTNAVVYFEEGRLAQAQKNAKGAQAAYERAAQLRDDFPEVYRQMGALYLESRDVDDALKTFNEALTRYKAARAPRQQLEAFYAEVVAGVTRAGKKQLADEWLKQARALH
jgi:tetratricopeptide (TPR) repeat protein